jgi:hypothetical protein
MSDDHIIPLYDTRLFSTVKKRPGVKFPLALQGGIVDKVSCANCEYFTSLTSQRRIGLSTTKLQSTGGAAIFKYEPLWINDDDLTNHNETYPGILGEKPSMANVFSNICYVKHFHNGGADPIQREFNAIKQKMRFCGISDSVCEPSAYRSGQTSHNVTKTVLQGTIAIPYVGNDRFYPGDHVTFTIPDELRDLDTSNDATIRARCSSSGQTDEDVKRGRFIAIPMRTTERQAHAFVLHHTTIGSQLNIYVDYACRSSAFLTPPPTFTQRITTLWT